MALHELAQVDDRAGDDTTPGGYTIDELARKVAMSARNIRAHQARRLLPPPRRAGRMALYDDEHVRRLEAIKRLQRQGFNLVAIEAVLGVRRTEPGGESVQTAVRRLGTEDPNLVTDLSRHGVIARSDDGSLRTVRPRLVQTALELRHAGVQPSLSMHLLNEILDWIRHLADELFAQATARILALHPALLAGAHTFEEFERAAVSLTQGLVAVLTEAFRVSIEAAGQSSVANLIALRATGEPRLAD
jgi:DNA-binding transcriptional MerR regulator